MAVAELLKSRSGGLSGKNPRKEYTYLVTGTTNDASAEATAIAAAPASIMTFLGPALLQDSADVSPVGYGSWNVKITYAPFNPTNDDSERHPETGESEFTFDFGGGSETITQSISVRESGAAPGKQVPKHNGAIHYEDGQVRGCSIVVPKYTFGSTHWVPTASVTDEYKETLAKIVGTTNDAKFGPFPRGEVLCSGVSGSMRGRHDWQLTFRFERERNRQNIQIGDLTIQEKRGWDYLELVYEKIEDGTTSKLVPSPFAYFVHQVYEESDFDDLVPT